MLLSRIRRTVIFAAVLVAGCGSEDKAPATGANPKAEQFFADYAKTLCEKLFGCCSLQQIRDSGAPFVTASSCDEFFADDFARVSKDLTRGLLKFNEAKAATAAAALHKITCQDAQKTFWDPVFIAFESALEPAVAAGGVCRDSGHCIDGYCALPVKEGDEKRCAPQKANGAMCTEFDECKGGFCSPSLAMCGDVKQVGSACAADEECTTLFCDINTSKCANDPAGGAGGVCDPP
jgi:hypothetical protein